MPAENKSVEQPRRATIEEADRAGDVAVRVYRGHKMAMGNLAFRNERMMQAAARAVDKRDQVIADATEGPEQERIPKLRADLEERRETAHTLGEEVLDAYVDYARNMKEAEEHLAQNGPALMEDALWSARMAGKDIKVPESGGFESAADVEVIPSKESHR
ncbi:hypothetical protein KW803_01210 [Candidatus Saccharibacteria bacterium]|nr:hypothetical protein [Candidatus Saccharibacteria bacterium]